MVGSVDTLAIEEALQDFGAFGIENFLGDPRVLVSNASLVANRLALVRTRLYKLRMGQRATLAFVFTAGWLAFASCVHATTHSFRYQLRKKCGFAEFVGDLLGAPNFGRRYDVEEDAQGRRVRTTAFQDGVQTMENRYEYSGDKKVPDRWMIIAHGKTNEVVNVTYGTNGCIKKLEFLTSDNQVTAYSTFEYKTNRVLVLKYDRHDTLRLQEVLIFNQNDILVRTRTSNPVEGARIVDTTYDAASGMETSLKEFIGKELRCRSECLYNAYGNLVSRKNYDKGRNILSGADYCSGVMTNQWYSENGGHTLSFRYSYDENGWTKETRVYQDERWVCLLTYERMSNGAPMRTLAKSVKGELWAEYANEEVRVIGAEGKVPQHPMKTKFYKTGRWW